MRKEINKEEMKIKKDFMKVLRNLIASIQMKWNHFIQETHL